MWISHGFQEICMICVCMCLCVCVCVCVGGGSSSPAGVLAELLGGYDKEPGPETKYCKGLSYASFPVSLRRYEAFI